MKRFALLLVAGVLTACGGHDATAPDPSAAVVGSYLLTRINTSTIPGVYYQDASIKIEFLSGSMSLRSDRSYTQNVSVRATDLTTGAVTTVPGVENGTFIVTGSQITFTIPADASGPALSYSGTVNGKVVSYMYDVDTYEFTRQ